MTNRNLERRSLRLCAVSLLGAAALSACVGEALSGGETLSSGGADGTGANLGTETAPTDGMSGAEPTTGSPGDCFEDGDPDAAAAYIAMLGEMQSVRDRLAAQVADGREVITSALGVATPAEIVALFAANLDSGLEYRTSPVLCPGPLEATLGSAAACAPSADAKHYCAGYTDGCQVCDGDLLLEVTDSTCEGTCYGSCAVDFGSACEGTCVGTCDGNCLCEAPSGECQGPCDGQCEGNCTSLAGECEGSCNGVCALAANTVGLDRFDRSWCSDCADQGAGCDGLVELSNIDQPCRAIAQATGLSAATCRPPLVGERFGISGDNEARKSFFVRLNAARPGFTSLVAAVEHIDRFDAVFVPALCSSSSENRYLQIRDELATVRASAAEFLATIELIRPG